MTVLSKLWPTRHTRAKRFESQFEPLQRQLHDVNEVFSASAMAESLEALEPMALELGECSAERGRLCAARSLLENKREDHDVALHYGRTALHIQNTASFLDDQSFFRLRHLLALSAEGAGEWDEALEHVRWCIEQPDSTLLTIDGRLGLRESEGFLLHEKGCFEEAAEVNTHLLSDAEQRYGSESYKLRSLLCNLAQNCYELGRFDDARVFLLRRLHVTRQAQAHELEADTLFQLGVLASERGCADEARGWFSERLQRAQAVDDVELIEAASEALTELERRLTADSCPPST